MMANYFILVVVFGVIVVDNINFVQCVYGCKTHADCSRYHSGSWPYCCGGYMTSVDKGRRRCTSRSCLNHYCSRDSDCGDATMCCRSNECVNQGCSGCTSDASCDRRHVCCKKTSRFNETVCATNCLGLTCNFNNDCSGSGECCRWGRCTNGGCTNYKCIMNSECGLGQYCCKKSDNNYGDGCSESCVGEICSTNEDCGAPYECCISNKCVDRGCSGCSTNSDCSTGQYCCKKKHWYEVSECSDHCIGKSCSTDDDCGDDYSEYCSFDEQLCERSRATVAPYVVFKTQKLFPPFVIAVVAASAAILAVVLFLTLFFYIKGKRQGNATRAENNDIPLQNIEHEAREEMSNRANAQPAYLNNPTYAASEVQSQNPAIFSQQFNENNAHHINPSGNEQNQGCQLTAMVSSQSNNEATASQYHDRGDQEACPRYTPCQSKYSFP